MRSRYEPDIDLGRDFYVEVSEHMAKRMRQRGISREAVIACLMFGGRTQTGGRVRVMLRKQDVPEGIGAQYGRYVGVICVLEGMTLISTYRRNRPAHARWSGGGRR